MEIKGKRRGGVPLKDKQDRLGEKGLGGWEGNYGTALHEGVIRMSRTERVEARSWLAGRRRDHPGGERDHSELPGLATQPGRSPAPVPARLEGKPSSHVEQQPQHPPSTALWGPGARATCYRSSWTRPPSFRETCSGHGRQARGHGE